MAIKPVPAYKLQEVGAWAVPKKKASPAVPSMGIGGPGGPVTGRVVLRGPDLGDPVQSVVAPGLPGGAVLPGASTKTTTQKIKPDYQLELTGDYMYGPTIDAFNSAIQGARTSLRDQIRRAVIQSGYDIGSQLTGGLAEYAGDIDPTTAAAAAANQFSDRAQLQAARDKGMSDLAYQLAGRGTLRSGAEAAGAGQINQSFQAQSNAQMNDLLSAISGGVGDYQNIYSQAQQNKNQALLQIADRLARLQAASYGDDGTDTGADVTNATPTPAPTPTQAATATRQANNQNASKAIQQKLRELGLWTVR